MRIRRTEPASLALGLGLAAVLSLPLLAAPAQAEGAASPTPTTSSPAPTGTPGGITLPWKSTRTGGVITVEPDDSPLAQAVASACTSGRPIYGTAVATWTAPRTMRVVAEQVTTLDLNGDRFDHPGGLAVVGTDGTVLACLTGPGLSATPVLTLSTGASLRLVQFVQEKLPDDGLNFEWTQTTLLAQAPGQAPANVAPASARPINSLPARLKVDLRLAPIVPASPVPVCPGNGDSSYGVDRVLWFRYWAPRTTSVIAESAGSTGLALAEATPDGPRWLTGACAQAAARATLEAGHTYLLAVAHTFEAPDTDLLDSLAPATITFRKVRATPPPPGITLPWENTFEALAFGDLPVDDSPLGHTVSAACLGGGTLYGSEVVSWTAPRRTTVVAEQSTTLMIGGEPNAEANGLAVVAGDGSVLACLTAYGHQVTPPLTVARGATVRLVRFVQRNPDYLNYAWSQSSRLTEVSPVR